MTPLTLYPAIDLMGGKCVRLSRGEADARTDYSDDPVGVARDFAAQGAQWIHLVDLEGAFDGASANWEVIERIRAAVDIKLELGGGVRDAETVERVLGAGIDRAVIGTWAARDPKGVGEVARQHAEKIAVGIDARDGFVAVKGWTETTTLAADDFAACLGDIGVKTIIATDIATDGMLTGPNTEFLENLAKRVPGVHLVASGGVATLDDLHRLIAMGVENIEGVIVGRALYTGAFTVAEALRAVS